MAIDVNELNSLQGDAFTAILPKEIAEQGYMKGVNGFSDFIKKFDGAQKMIGGSERIPGADATPEQWTAFFSKAGRPEKPEGYTLPKVEGVPDDFIKKASEIGMLNKLLHESDVTVQQANKFLPKFLKTIYDAENSEKVASEAAFSKTMDAVFGTDRQAILDRGKAMLATMIPDNVKPLFAQLDDKAMAVVLASIEGVVKKHVSEDGFRPPVNGGGGGGKTLTAQDIQGQMQAIFADPAYRDPFVDKAKNAQLTAKMAELREMANKL